MRNLLIPTLAALALACASQGDLQAEKPAGAAAAVASTQVARLVLDRVP